MARRKDPENSFQPIRRRLPPLKQRRSIAELSVSAEEAARFEARHEEPAPVFKEPGLQDLYERGLVVELVRQLRSGKEATVYIARTADGYAAVKVYKKLLARSFRNDAIYRQGRHVGDARLQRAIDQHSRHGIAAQQALWVEEEYRQLVALHAAGVNVPRPLGFSGAVVMMEFIGEDALPAPRLSDMPHGSAELPVALEQAIENLCLIVGSGRAHGDYSTYNLLWWRGHVVVIDLPQVVELASNTHAVEILRRDVLSLSSSFRKLGLSTDPADLWERLAAEAPGIIIQPW
jgi:RIO kinase 1